MAVRIRTGAPTFARLITKACKMSHTNGFLPGFRQILGTTTANDLYAAWTTFCVLWEAMLALDDQPFQIDATTGEEQDRPA